MTDASIPDFAEIPSAADDAYVPVGVDGVLAATQKALAINRGLVEPDHRDGIQFKRILGTPELLAERVKLDATGSLRKVLGHAARHRSLKGFMPGALSDLVEKHITGSALASPLEEINPLDVANQARRVTLLGPGGVSSSDMITSSMQEIHPSIFGFLSPIEGPECFDDLSEVYTLRGWVKWPDVRASDVFACRIDGKLEWHKAERIIAESYRGTMLVGENEAIRMCVTPNHRVLYTNDQGRAGGAIYKMATAEQVYGRSISIPIKHAPFIGDETLDTFNLPAIPITNNYQKVHGPLRLIDWAEFLGWWLSEGSSCAYFSTKEGRHMQSISISQCSVVNPTKFQRIRALLIRLGFVTEAVAKAGRAFTVGNKQLHNYFKCYTGGCYDKWIPEECFSWPVAARKAMLEALLLGDGRYNKKRICYCTVSYRLALSVERLAISLGYPAFIRIEQDRRAHVKTTNYVVSISRAEHRSLKAHTNGHKNGRRYGNYWSTQEYAGVVYCATVPGGLLLVRGKPGTAGFWSGNSGHAGVDTRIANGVRVGSNGRLYQRFRNPRTGDIHWLSPEDLRGKVVGLPR